MTCSRVYFMYESGEIYNTTSSLESHSHQVLLLPLSIITSSFICSEMKRVNFSCVSPASAAICTSIDRRSMVRPSTSRALDRHTPPLQRDPGRRAKPAALSSLSRLSTDQKFRSHHGRKSSAAAADDDKPSDLLSPRGSSRYLLHEDAFFDVFPAALDSAPPPPLSLERRPQLHLDKEESAVFEPSPAPATSQKQIVHLRVSLHCKGCEAKVRKHISRMEGVTSFNIDFETKKVTVVGEVTPLGVLNSISKVKNAQFWPLSTSF